MFKRIFILIIIQIFLVALLAKQQPDFNKIVQKQRQAALIKTNFYQQIWEVTKESREMNNYDVLFYDLEVEIDFEEEYIEAQNMMRAEILEDQTSEVELHFTNELEITNILQNSQLVNFMHENDLITITLDDEYNAGEEIELTIQYEGYPENRLNDGMKFQEHNGIPIVFTMVSPRGARKWWPCKDTPADKPDSIAISITYPEEYICASNGTLQSQTVNGNGTITDHWFEMYPVATYLTSFAVTNYEIFSYIWNYEGNQMPIDNYYYPEQAAVSINLYGLTGDMLTFFSDVYGLYPFVDEKYGHATCTNLGALAMEHQTCTSFDAAYITDEAAEYTVAHELAHQWAGDCLSIGSWSDVWLKEGFASYSEALWAEHLFGEEALKDYMLAEDGGAQLDECLYRDPDGTANHIFNWVVYAKGSWTLHMLRYTLGDDDFFQLMNDYMQDPDHKYGNVITQDLENAAENFMPELDWFFDQWYYNYGRPRYKYAVYSSSIEDSIKITSFSEGSSGDPFSMYIPFNKNGEEGRLWIADGFNFHTLQQQTLLDSFVFDPDNWILDYGFAEQFPELIEVEENREGSVVLVWEEYFDEQIEGMNIYRKQAGGNYEQINVQPVSGTAFYDDSVTAGEEYFYKIAACFTSAGNYLGEFSNEILVTPIDFTFDEGILIVDGTRDNPATSPFPTDAEVDEFYEQVLEGYQLTTWDIFQAGYPPLTELAKYSSIIWHTDDFVNYPFSQELYNPKSYLLAGGNMLISSWKNLYELEENFHQEYLGFTDAATNDEADFSGAFGEAGFADIEVDPEKIELDFWNDNLMYVNKFTALENAEVIFRYDSSTDDPVWENMPCAQKYENGYKIYTFGFPLYFIEQSGVEEIIANVMEDFGEVTSSQDFELQTVNYQLNNYPNPFNPITEIRFQISDLKQIEKAEIEIYNLKGQKVQQLVSDQLSAGQHTVVWNGNDRNNRPVSSGIYFYNLMIDGKQAASNKMLFLK